MHTIYKYPLQITGFQTINMPVGAEVLHAGLDPSGKPCVWALVGPPHSLVPHHFYVIGTGNPIKDAEAIGEHVGSFVDGSFVWHVFLG